MTRSRRRSLYCSPAEWAEITERAQAAGMSNSAFLMACAFAEDSDVPDTVLALDREEQRTLYERIAFLDRCNRAMYERLPGTDLSMFGALAFLCRAAGEEEDAEASE